MGLPIKEGPAVSSVASSPGARVHRGSCIGRSTPRRKCPAETAVVAGRLLSWEACAHYRSIIYYVCT